MKKLILYSLLFATPMVSAEDDHRHHEAHQHGHAKMNLAWVANELSIEFISPADNLVGFEYKPTKPGDKTTLQQAISKLNKPLQLITPNKEAVCSVKSVSIDSPLIDEEHHEEDHDHDKHDEDHDHDKHEEDHDHDKHEEDHDHDKHEEEHHDHDEHEDDKSAHSDFDISITYQCKNADRLQSVETRQLFSNFSRIEEIEVQWISAQKQAATELTPSSTLIKLK